MREEMTKKGKKMKAEKDQHLIMAVKVPAWMKAKKRIVKITMTKTIRVVEMGEVRQDTMRMIKEMKKTMIIKKMIKKMEIMTIQTMEKTKETKKMKETTQKEMKMKEKITTKGK